MVDHLEKAKSEWKTIYPELNLESAEFLAILSQVSNIIFKKRSAFLKKMELAPWSFDTLSLLGRSQGKTLTPSNFMDELGITSGTMTHRIDLLEKQGLVIRKKDTNDGRSVNIELTDKGLSVIEEALKRHVYESDLLLSVLSDTERKTVAEVIRKLLDKLNSRPR